MNKVANLQFAMTDKRFRAACREVTINKYGDKLPPTAR
jgi:hypothetical protein